MFNINTLLKTCTVWKRHIKWSSFYCNPLQPAVPSFSINILENGMRVTTEESSSPLACISLFVEAGPRYETASNNGITHFIEHMLFKGYKCGGTIEDCLSRIGASMTVKTGREIQVITAKCFPECAGFIVDIFSKIILEPIISECEIEIEKRNMCLELIDTDNNPKEVVFDYLHATAFQGTPLGQRVIGPTKNIQHFDRDFMLRFLMEHYQPCRMVLASSGCLCHGSMVALASQKFGKIVGEGLSENEVGACRYTGSETVYRDDSMPFAHVAIAVEAPGFTSDDYLAMFVASCVLDSWDKSQSLGLRHSTLLGRASSLGELCERFESFYIPYRDVGLWGIYFVSKRMGIDDMISYVQDEWMNLSTVFHKSDFDRALNIAKVKLARAVEGPMNSCHDLGLQMTYQCCRRNLPDLYRFLANMRSKDMQLLLEKHILDRCPVVAAVGPTETLPEYNRTRAGMNWLRI